jgi:hypothetical protein
MEPNMTSANILKPMGFALLGLVVGWWSRSLFESRNTSVMSFNESATVVEVKGKNYGYSELPIAMQHRIHSAYLQAHGIFRTQIEDYAARIVAADGKDLESFRWEKLVEKKITEEQIRNTYNNALGFKETGELSDPKVRSQVIWYLTQGLVAQRISEEVSNLIKEKRFKINWQLPLASKVNLDASEYPVVEVGSEKDAKPFEMQVMFSYNQQNSESAFFAISRVAETMGRRVKIRLLSESGGTAKEGAAIALVNCLASAPEFKREAWLVHARLLQELYRMPEGDTEIQMQKLFPGDSELVKKVATCKPKPIAEKVLAENTAAWKEFRPNPYPMIFVDGRRISEQDPRGVEGVLREMLGL